MKSKEFISLKNKAVQIAEARAIVAMAEEGAPLEAFSVFECAGDLSDLSNGQITALFANIAETYYSKVSENFHKKVTRKRKARPIDPLGKTGTNG